MQIFLSWSGNRSGAFAHELRAWLPCILQAVNPWMSAHDIRAGARWNSDLDNALNDISFGIICLTNENLFAPWIYFEAGALAKSVEHAHLCPYLLGIEPSDIPDGPLAQFQAKRTNKEETLQLVQTINEALGSSRIPTDSLDRAFQKWWPDLEASIQGLRNEPLQASEAIERPERELIVEVLERVRALSTVTMTTQGSTIGDVTARAMHQLDQRLERILRCSELAASEQNAVIYSTAQAMWNAAECVLEEIVMDLQHTEGDCAASCLAKVRRIEAALMEFARAPHTEPNFQATR
jgi:hypothetical protein